MPIHPLQFPLIKASATANDFLLADTLNSTSLKQWEKDFGSWKRSDLAKKLCDRHHGLGADGFIVLEPAGEKQVRWDFYNSDGSSAEMCGNAARAVALYVWQTQGLSQMTLLTGAGAVEAVVHSPDKIAVTMPAISEDREEKDYHFVRSGVPHAVLAVKDWADGTTLDQMARKIKARPEFKKDGTNVTFYKSLADDKIESRTHERGVEGFTMSCGTGAVAAAWVAGRGRGVEVRVPGGVLNVVWKNNRPHLTGPAEITGVMQWLKENLK